MKVLSRNLLSKGFSPFVKMVDIPYSPDDPHMLALYQEGDKNVAGTATVTLELTVPVVVEVITKEQIAALLFTK